MADETPAIDRIDRRIIDELRQEGRISWRELADRVHLAPSSVADRVRRLEERGLIRGYAAQVDPAAFGRSVRAVIDVGLPPGVDPAPFEALLAGRDEVAFAAYVTGQSDYTIVVDCAGAAGLDTFIRWLKADAGVARTESRFVLRPIVG
ncbi:MAG: Lrp/AsnC family transcriptional regulator [Acidimicrobiales bacterium]|nr:Lrp/AsnC family transcriptional regulator [Acidimicrobiales bacterium]MCB9395241.1 Lrp/AsnC family transcriptional regulator [Acidimicrobiaceae bacterium]